MKIHLVGIAGTGMGSFAMLLAEAGHEVRGSDTNVYPPMSVLLEKRGIPVMQGFRAENLDWTPDLVVVGNVCRPTNVEAIEAETRGLSRTSFPAALGRLFLAERHSVVVAGTHGKTTTSALAAWTLFAERRDPSFLVGGECLNFEGSARLGRGPHFVVEGDEYDTAFFDKGPKFLHYRPRTAILTSVEFDHADIYRDLAHVTDAFRRFVAIVPESGTIVACGDHPLVEQVAREGRARVVTYGLGPGSDLHAARVVADEVGTAFDLMRRGASSRSTLGRIHIPLWGEHNVTNAIGVAAAALEALGLGLDELREAFAGFKGVRRRQEVRGVAGGVTVLDDFAHHPTAVRETVKAMRARFPRARLWALFEPRSATSCRAIFQKDFADALALADRVIIGRNFRAAEIAAEQSLDAGRVAADVAAAGVPAQQLDDVDAMVAAVAAEAREGDVLLCMSNGAFGGIHGKLLATLGAR